MTKILDRDNVWTMDNSASWDGAVIVVAATSAGVSIAVSEEKAVDSYNAEFTCTIQMTPEEALALAVFIIRSTTPPAVGG